MVHAKQLAEWFPSKKAKAPAMKNESVFYRNLEEALDIKRAENATFNLRKNEPNPDSIDFSTLDFLHISKTGMIRKPFLDELAANPNFSLGAGGSRLLNGNNAYTEGAEQEIAEFHSGDTSLMFHSGFEANVAIMVAVPRPGDAIVYDELVHASMHEGVLRSKALCKKSFKHNDLDSFREVLLEVQASESLIRDGKRSILVALESLYSMDGDLCPLKEIIEIGEEIFPDGNIQFFVDEAHTTGVFGDQGRGFVNELGLEDKIAIRMHTFGKAFACTGGMYSRPEVWNGCAEETLAVVVCNETIRDTLVNTARCFIYSTAPSFPMVAAIKAGYNLMRSGQTGPVSHQKYFGQKLANKCQLQDNIRHIVRHFCETIQENEVWDEANDEGILSIPNMEDWENKEMLTQVMPVMTRQRYTKFLCYHLQLEGINCFPIDYPVIPRGMNRLRIVFHATNTEEDAEKLANGICDFAKEMLEIEASGKGGVKIPSAARQVYAAQAAAETEKDSGAGKRNVMMTGHGNAISNGINHMNLGSGITA